MFRVPAPDGRGPLPAERVTVLSSFGVRQPQLKRASQRLGRQTGVAGLSSPMCGKERPQLTIQDHVRSVGSPAPGRHLPQEAGLHSRFLVTRPPAHPTLTSAQPQRKKQPRETTLPAPKCPIYILYLFEQAIFWSTLLFPRQATRVVFWFFFFITVFFIH